MKNCLEDKDWNHLKDKNYEQSLQIKKLNKELA